jgi:formate hydrogenlyase transcriptional activator
LTGESATHFQAAEESQFKLLAQISARFVSVPASEIDFQIEDTQRTICEFHRIDHCSLWQVAPENPGTFLLTHVFRDPSLRPRPDRMVGTESFPWVQSHIVQSILVCVPDVEDVPAEAAADQRTWHDYSVKSTLVLPLSIGGGAPFGALSFEATYQARDWPPSLVEQLQYVAQLFASALHRKFSEEALRHSENRLSLAAASADAGLWTLNPASGRIWATEKAKELFGTSPDAEIDVPYFYSLVHSEDRETVQKKIDEGMQTGNDVSAEYRIQLPDGTTRWISSRGRRQTGSLGEPDRLMGVSVDVTEITELRRRLEAESDYLRSEIEINGSFGEIVGDGKALKKVYAQIQQVAPTDTTVLISGETGTGKELIARAIHNLSTRKNRVMVKVDCSALPATLIESELFGRERGAYTGALTSQIGRFEFANGSTLFLDEIGELPLELQAKLLRVLQDGELERLGNPKPIKVDVRVLAATNRDLPQKIKDGSFRQDLYYRLKVFPIPVPPLRERAEDIPSLVWTFVREFERKMGKHIDSIPKKTMEALALYAWPGNVRELRHLIEQGVIITTGRQLQVELPVATDDWTFSSLEATERKHILAALERTNWRVKGVGGAAQLLGIKPTTLYGTMKRLGIPSWHSKYRNPS